MSDPTASPCQSCTTSKRDMPACRGCQYFNPPREEKARFTLFLAVALGAMVLGSVLFNALGLF